MQSCEPLLVDTATACHLLGIKRTKLFELMNQLENGLQRRKCGRKTLVTMESLKAYAERGDV
jgi:hypothetical protein